MIAIDSPYTNPYLNLAAEEYLLKEREDDVFFLYTDEPSVIVGKHQVTVAEVNYSFAVKNHIQIARRLSGGGAVYHDKGNLNFTLIQNGTEGALVKFQACIAPILEALHAMHVPAKTGLKNDLLLHGKKISGNAEHIYHKRTLHHGTLLFNSDLNQLRQVLHPEGNYLHKGVLSRRSEVLNIASSISIPDIESFRKFLFTFVSERFNASLYSLMPEEMKKIQTLADNKYKTWEWIYAYSPDYTLEKEIGTRHGTVNLKLSVSKGCISKIILTGGNQPDELENIRVLLQGAPLKEDYLRKTIPAQLPSASSIALFYSLLPGLF